MNALISIATTALLIGFSATPAQSRCLAWTAINEVEENMAKGCQSTTHWLKRKTKD